MAHLNRSEFIIALTSGAWLVYLTAITGLKYLVINTDLLNFEEEVQIKAIPIYAKINYVNLIQLSIPTP